MSVWGLRTYDDWKCDDKFLEDEEPYVSGWRPSALSDEHVDRLFRQFCEKEGIETK